MISKRGAGSRRTKLQFDNTQYSSNARDSFRLMSRRLLKSQVASRSVYDQAMGGGSRGRPEGIAVRRGVEVDVAKGEIWRHLFRGSPDRLASFECRMMMIKGIFCIQNMAYWLAGICRVLQGNKQEALACGC